MTKASKKLKKLKCKAERITDEKVRKKLINDWLKRHRRFDYEDNTKQLKDCFKLKQQYMVKII